MSKRKSGLGFLNILTLILITLKLMGTITFSWLWVLSPLWLPVGIYIIAILIVSIVLGMFGILTKKRVKKLVKGLF